MRKIIVVGLAAVVIGGGAAGVVVNKAGAAPDPEALLLALNDAAPDTAGGTPSGPVVRHEDADPDEVPLALEERAPADAEAMMLAQNGPPPPGAGPGMPPPPPPGMPGRPMMGGHPGMPGGWGQRPLWHRAAMFGLFYRRDDKALTPADVQKIAEAFLLWQGNRDWKVTQVSAGPDGKIGFAFATSDGGVIARFTMDSKTGRIARVG